MILLFWVLNFVISCFNAWACGKSWNETKYVGGLPHFMNWMGAIMAACGFTWCYLVIVGAGAAYIPLVEQDDGTLVPLLDPTSLQVFFDLGYLVIIGPILGSGLAITMQAWAYAWRRRTFADAAVAGWDTFAMVYNVSSALEAVPAASGRVFSFFTDGDGDDAKGALIAALVVVALFGGILTTYLIVTSVARSTANNMAFKHGAHWNTEPTRF
jgi:hypothetical protein